MSRATSPIGQIQALPVLEARNPSAAAHLEAVHLAIADADDETAAKILVATACELIDDDLEETAPDAITAEPWGVTD